MPILEGVGGPAESGRPTDSTGAIHLQAGQTGSSLAGAAADNHMSSSNGVAGLHAERLLAILQDVPAVGHGRMRVLVLDDEPATADVLSAHLPQADAEVLYASSVDGAREKLADGAVTVTVCNPAIAGENAWRFFSQLMEHAARTGMQVVAIRRQYDESVSDVELYLLGVDVVLGPPVQRNELIALLRSQLRKIARQRESSLTDGATGYPNLAVFQEAYQRAASLAAREHESLTLVLLHVGALDRVRRGAGLETADELLREVGSGAAETLRQSDLLARGSGDSFLMLLPNTDRAGAERVIEKIHDRLARRSVIERVASFELALVAGATDVDGQDSLQDAVEAAAMRLQPLRSALERALAEDPATSVARKHRILLGEDDLLTASIIRHRLERLGHEVVHLTDGAAVMKAAPEAELSLMILDVKMPYVDGFEVLRRLRSIRPMRELPVMLVTSMGNEEDIARGFELGCDDYLVKPFSPVELQARVQRLLR